MKVRANNPPYIERLENILKNELRDRFFPKAKLKHRQLGLPSKLILRPTKGL